MFYLKWVLFLLSSLYIIITVPIWLLAAFLIESGWLDKPVREKK